MHDCLPGKIFVVVFQEFFVICIDFKNINCECAFPIPERYYKN